MEGKGLIKKSKQINVFSRVCNIVFVTIGLYLGLKLWAVLIGYVFLLIVFVYYSRKSFFTNDMKKELEEIVVASNDLKNIFNRIWYNSKKVAIIYFSGFLTNKSSLFIAGIYLDLATVAAMGLMMQFVSLIASLSETVYLVMQPEISSLRVQGQFELMNKRFACAIVTYLGLFILGSIVLIVIIPFFLDLIGSNTKLPSSAILCLYCIIYMLERQHATFAAFIATGNRILWLESSVIVGFLILAGSFTILKYTQFGLLGLIAVQGILQLCYANWKWPYEALKEINVSYLGFIWLGISELANQMKTKKFYR